ncbi:forespore capture DNA-binding protein RefZ [Bacillus sp. 1P06AnD]|uniref:forespore capture DNA-binding protein RefZ n=1 Tax=Bacillus sp. 1P06AnD TaxID=3132208 RepID=UPI0039A2B3EA
MTVKKSHVKNNTKNEIIKSALYLFHANGFDGTSIRDIAARANINPANIAYYFKNKSGLLEYCFIHYLEGYIQVIEKDLEQLEYMPADQCLFSIVTNLLEFQNENMLAARFVTREMSLDTMLNREVLSTYMAKESYYLHYVIEQAIQQGRMHRIHIPSFILQLKGLLSAPVSHSQYASEVLHMPVQDTYYQKQYTAQCLNVLSLLMERQLVENV